MDLPNTHYDLVRRTNKAIFEFLARDLERLRSENKIPEDIIPPNGQCMEDHYLEGFIAHAQRSPQHFPWLHNPAAHHSVLSAVIREYRFLLAYEHGGRKTYYFSPGLTENLAYTTLNIRCNNLRLPFPGFAFVFDSPVAIEAYHALLGSPVQQDTVLTVYVREDNLDEMGFRRLLLCVYETNGDRTLGGISRQLAMKSNWDLEQALRTDWDSDEMRELDRQLGIAPPPGKMTTLDDGTVVVEDGDPEAFFKDGLQFIRLVLNGILYLTSRDVETVECLSHRKVTLAQPKAATSTSPVSNDDGKRQFFLVGPSVEPIPIIIDPLKRYNPSNALEREKRRVKVQFIVAGFWRRKPSTPANAPKDVWVRPHRKGPDMATLVNKPYVVR